jgi:hypothetical protein
MKLIPGFLALALGLPLSALHGSQQQYSSEPIDSRPSMSRTYSALSPSWYWVYEGVAHGQTFVATGTQIEALQLRVARLNDGTPQGALQVEVRSSDLRVMYVRGTIAASAAGREFRWTGVQMEQRASLEKGKSYVLLIHSKATRHNAPWLINSIFEDVYPSGRHLGYTDDLFFSLSFSSGTELHVGPPTSGRSTIPVNSGRKGGTPVPTTPALRFGGQSLPVIARYDPLGPIPSALSAEALTSR